MMAGITKLGNIHVEQLEQGPLVFNRTSGCMSTVGRGGSMYNILAVKGLMLGFLMGVPELSGGQVSLICFVH